MHVLFDETNSLIEHDTQEEEFELGLMRKDFSLTRSSMIDNSKAHEVESNPESGNVEGEQGVHQSVGCNVEPNLV